MEEIHDNIFWHDAFYEAIQLELAEYKSILVFKNEHQLSKEALQMDVLIIKKDKNAEIKKNIGRIFKGHNICEYKSETDSLSVFDYNKVIGYALLYSTFEHIDINNVTITLSLTKHPRELFRYLRDERGLEIIEMFSGVYYVIGDMVPVQILESKRLSEDDNLFLKSLRSNLRVDDMLKLLNVYQRQGTYDKNNVYLNRILEANMQILKEVSKMSMMEVDAILKEAAFKRDWFIEAVRKSVEEELIVISEEVREEGREEGRKKGREDNAFEVAHEMILDGEAIERIAKWTKLPIDTIRELQKQINIQ